MKATSRSKLCRGVAAVALLGFLTSCAMPSGAPDNTVSVSELPAEDVDALMGVAKTAESEGDPKTALSLYQKAAQASPEDVEPLMAAGRVAAANGQPNEAARAYQKVVQIDPNNLEARYGLGRALAAQDLPNAAIKHFEAMLEVDRGDARAYNGLGIAFDLLGDHREAQSQYRTGMSIAPENISLQNNLAYSLILTGDHEEAVSLLEKVVQRPNATPQSHRNLALAYNLMGRDEDSRAVVLSGDGIDDMARAITSYQSEARPQSSGQEDEGGDGSRPLASSSSGAAGALGAAAASSATAYQTLKSQNAAPAGAQTVEESADFEVDPEGPAPEETVTYRGRETTADLTPAFLSSSESDVKAAVEETPEPQAPIEDSLADPLQAAPEGSREPTIPARTAQTADDAKDTTPAMAGVEAAAGELDAQAAVKTPSPEERRVVEQESAADVSEEQSDEEERQYSLLDQPSLQDRAAAEGLSEAPSLQERFLQN